MSAAEPVEGAAAAVERAARDSYGRLLSFLAARTGDVAGAEDALSDAFAAALRRWPETGTPERPEAWLLTTARRRLVDFARRAAVRDTAMADLAALAQTTFEQAAGETPPDERLGLMMACAHPAIDAAARTPLMLQTVLGVDAARISAAYVVSPTAMSQRLVRAKTKIREAGVPFDLPDIADWPGRIGAVADAIYAAYGLGWEDVGDDDARGAFAAEAEWLARLVVQLAPRDGEAKGLLALILFCESRRGARRAVDGAFIPLSDQDTALWRMDLADDAQALLIESTRGGGVGRYRIEAAIQSVHMRRAETGRTDWPAVAALYDLLVKTAPSIGAEVARAAALGEARGLEAGLAVLEAAPQDRMSRYQPYWAVRAHLLARAGRYKEARSAFRTAADLATDPAAQAHLARQADQL